MIISARIVKRPRRPARCGCCDKLIEGTAIRTYGMAETGDPPYILFYHMECRSNMQPHPKIDAAIAHMKKKAGRRI